MTLFIFLNKACFNGLYRVNRSGAFNVPFGKYKNPTICDRENLRNVSKVLQKVEIHCGNYTVCYDFVDETSLVYFDPPYRPLNATSSFTAYTENSFNDTDQIALAEFYKKLSEKGVKVLLSNSDPKNTNKEDEFCIVKNYERRKMKKYIVTIEEMVSKDFIIEAEDSKQASIIAEQGYNNGKYVLEPGDLIYKQMQVACSDGSECVDCVEF